MPPEFCEFRKEVKDKIEKHTNKIVANLFLFILCFFIAANASWLSTPAVYFFRLPDYDAAMSLLNQVDFDHDPLAQLNGRTMLLRIYYEKKYTDALESLLDSFSIFLRRQRNVGYQRAHFQNLIQFTRRLLALSPGDKGGAAALKTDIEHSKSVAEKEWLLEKVLRVN